MGGVVDPVRNAVHTLMLRVPRPFAPRIREARSGLVDHVLLGGPDAPNDLDKRAVLWNAAALLDLHGRVWRLEDSGASARRGLADMSECPSEPGGSP